MAMIKHVVFDFDGTIANTASLVPEVVNEVLEYFKKPCLSDDELSHFMSMGWREAIKEYGLKWYDLPKYALAAQQAMHKKLDTVNLYEDIKEVLMQLSEEFTTNIISLNSTENIRHVIDKHDLPCIMEVFSAKGRLTKQKLLKKYLKQFNIENNEILYIGDELGDIIACKKNDIKVIAVTWGYDSKEMLSSGNPDFLVDSPLDIAEIIEAY